LVTHVAVLHHNSALLVRYGKGHDRQQGWFLPNDDLRHPEHPDQAAKRILNEHVGIEDASLKLVEIESFVGDNETWHLIFDYLAFPRSMKVSTGAIVSEAKWFEIDKLPSAEEFAHHGWGKAVLLKHALAKAQPTAARWKFPPLRHYSDSESSIPDS
jgi:ADP-ribose pyrophosphatase YjhB (NUDIX family)